MITENLSTLKIHKLSKEQYKRELDAGNIDETALYLTPDNDLGDTNAVNKSGDTMTGALTTPELYIKAAYGNMYPALHIKNDDGNIIGSFAASPPSKDGAFGHGTTYIINSNPSLGTYEAFYLPQMSNDGANHDYNILTTKNVVDVRNGGTGAFGAAQARINLGIGATSLYSGSLTSGFISFDITGSFLIVVGRLITGGSLTSTVIPVIAITTTDTKWQIADNLYYYAFNLKREDNNIVLTKTDASNASGEIIGVYGVY